MRGIGEGCFVFSLHRPQILGFRKETDVLQLICSFSLIAIGILEDEDQSPRFWLV